MTGAFNSIPTILFDSHNVVVFKIPPGKASLSRWHVNDLNIIWKGKLRAIEQELFIEDLDLHSNSEEVLETVNTHRSGEAAIRKELRQEWEQNTANDPYQILQLKLELFNERTVSDRNQKSEVSDENVKEAVWGEVWFNPLASDGRETAEDRLFGVSKDGGETIMVTPESSRYYKIITQIPGTGCQFFASNSGEKSSATKTKPLQVALGLMFENSYDAVSFADALRTYKRRFNNLLEQYDYEMKLAAVQHGSKNLWIESDIDTDSDDSLLIKDDQDQSKPVSLPENNVDIEGRNEMDDSEDEEFGDFVEN